MTEWQPIETEPGDFNYRLYRLTVQSSRDGRVGHEWVEIHYLARDQDTGDMLDASGDVFSDWGFDDFEHWAPAPTMPAHGEIEETTT
jgi:hypothetical protein